MDQFVWKPEYSVGDATIDRQHQELIVLMNDLYQLLQLPEAEQGEGMIDHLFGGLAEYIYTHFAYEEQRMVDARYPEASLAKHREEHNKIIRTIRQYHAQTSEGNTAALKDLLPFLYGDWLIHHICESDMDYVPYLKAQSTR